MQHIDHTGAGSIADRAGVGKPGPPSRCTSGGMGPTLGTMPGSTKVPEEIDHATGLPKRELASAVCVNASPEREDQAGRFAIEAAQLLSDDKCENVLVLDLRGLSQITDFLVIATGTSDRQMRSVGFHVEELGKEHGLGLYRDNLKESEPAWVFLDFVDLVVHLLEAETRAHYDLEMLWGDAPRLSWERTTRGPDGASTGAHRNRAGLRPDDVLPGQPG